MVSKNSLITSIGLLLTIAVTISTMYYISSGERVAEPVSGQVVYQRNCAGCHGTNGKGNGPAAEYLYPKPRDFTSGVYKFTSTPNGKLPTDTDIERVVREGLSPAGMPGFRDALSKRQIANVADYVKTFSDRFPKESVPEPVKVPEPPESLMSQNRIQQGKNIYGKYCTTCHGQTGEGDGPSADSLRDRWGDPIRPRDLTRGQYKAGGDVNDLYWRIMTGINGAGMPPYSGLLKDVEDRWALIAYVRSLNNSSKTKIDPPGSSGTFRVRYTDVKSNKLKQPTSAIWETSNRRRMNLYSLWVTDRTPFNSVEVRALHNGEFLALRLSWNDPTANVKPVGQTEFTDATAVMFPNLKGAVPFLGMGDQQMEGGIAHIWHWRAVDQFAVDRGGTTVDMEDKYPYMDVTYYQNKKSFEPGNQADFSNWQQYSTNQPDTFLSSTASGNTLGKQTLEVPVRSYRAEGFGSLTALDESNMCVDGNGKYQNDRWTVVMMRPLKTKTRVVQFEPGETHNAAFAVWDGEQNDRNGQKDITSWISLKLQKPATKKNTASTNNP